MPIITLLTDFGTQDHYVAAMKGIILGLNPHATLVDLSHDIPPQDIMAGAFVLAGAAPYFPPGTIHLAVVDPGVGSARRALAARSRGQYWVGPDNGLFSLAWGSQADDLAMVSLTEPAYFRPSVSDTFHGRDLFAPVAAHLSLGVALAQFGPGVSDPTPLPFPEPEFGPARASGQVIFVDRFGNLVTNLKASALLIWLGGQVPRLRLASLRLNQICHTYAEAPPQTMLALLGSHGYLEIACAQGSAARRLRVGPGAVIEVEKTEL
jgi:S-adenosylmethionine hydrolase